MWVGMEKKDSSFRNYFFVGISIKLFCFLLLARFFNWRIYVIDNTSRPFVFKMIQKMHKHQWIKRVTEHHSALFNSNSIAIKLADKIINQMSDSAVIKSARELYKSKETDLVFKKTLAKHITLLTSLNQYIINNQKIIKPTLFISKRYRKILQGNPEILDKSIKVKFGFYWGGLQLRTIWLVMSFGYLIHLLIQPFCKKNINRKIFKYAISIAFPWATKFKGAREFTFLVDDNIIKKNEVVFLVEYPESKQFYQHYSSSGYNLREASKGLHIKNLFSFSNLDVRHDFSKIVSFMITHKEDFFIYETLIFLLISRISWSVITNKVVFKNYIYFNKEYELQIAGNIFLKKKQVTTHAYSQFIGGSYQVSGNNSIWDNRNLHFSFLNPDYYYVNNQAMIDSMKLHHQDTVHHKNIGNIFSEKVIEMKGNLKYMEDLKHFYNIKTKQKIVSIFDTSYVEQSTSYSNYDEAKYFLRDIILLAKSLPNCTFLFKPSKDSSFFLTSYWADEKGNNIMQLRHEFNQLANAFMLSDDDDVIDIISLSNVVVTNSFSSPTADALMSQVPAFWYQAKTDVSFSVYNKVPGLVVNGYEDLNTMVKEMLQDDYKSDIFDDPEFLYLIGDSKLKALTALRVELSNV